MRVANQALERVLYANASTLLIAGGVSVLLKEGQADGSHRKGVAVAGSSVSGVLIPGYI